MSIYVGSCKCVTYNIANGPNSYRYADCDSLLVLFRSFDQLVANGTLGVAGLGQIGEILEDFFGEILQVLAAPAQTVWQCWARLRF